MQLFRKGSNLGTKSIHVYPSTIASSKNECKEVKLFYLPKVQFILTTTKKPKSKLHWSLKTKVHLIGIIINPKSNQHWYPKRSHLRNRVTNSKNTITYLHFYMHCIHCSTHNFPSEMGSFQKIYSFTFSYALYTSSCISIPAKLGNFIMHKFSRRNMKFYHAKAFLLKRKFCTNITLFPK